MAVDEVGYRHTFMISNQMNPMYRMSITKTLSSLSKSGQGRPVSDTEMLRWANTTAQKGKPGTKSIRSFKDPSITTGLFFLNVLEGIKPGIVDPSLVYNVSDQGDYEERRQNGVFTLTLENTKIVH
jgi:plastin-1